MRKPTFRSIVTQITLTSLAFGLIAVVSGCHDGPLYALKHVNPYFTMKEWREDDALGVTDHERRNQLIKLADTIHTMPANRQAYWSNHLNKMIELDPNAEMRRLAISAAGKMQSSSAIDLIEKGLEDDNIKVRMESCRALGKRRESQAASLLASTFGSETELDVKHAALAAISNHKGQVPINSARIALNDRNPATQRLAMQSLRGITGKDFGQNPDAWIKAIGVPEMNPGSPSGIGAPPNSGPAVQIANGNSATRVVPASNTELR